MSYYKVISECPAYKVLDGSECSFFKPGSKLCIDGRAKYKLGDAASYALENGMCPVEALEKCKEKGHEQYWITQLATCISSTKLPQEVYYGLKSGDVIKYAGKRFQIVPQNNQNYGLKEVA